MTTAIGIDLGGTNIKGVLLNAKGHLIHRAERATQPGTAGEGWHWKQTVSQMIAELKSKSAHPVKAIGLAAPGLPNESNSAIRLMPVRLNGLENLIWTDYLGEKKVWVLNDAHAALIAEARFGIGQGIKNIVMLTWGTGVGGGVLMNGELYQGNYQMAGHLGHMILDVDNEGPGITGMPGTLENAIGDATISKRSFGRIQSTYELVKAYRQGDPFATFIWLNTIRKLAMGICSLCNLLSPELVILGGGVTKAGDALYKPLAEFIDVYEWKNTGKKTPVKQAGYGEMAGAVGAAGFAFSKADLSG
ncbi:ROK family protein [Agriterribacter sp.]|uniref:ROK family protein n=1 Tax=Agriterribacter sp. TaxID=2821509 RepID=UPI002CD8F909|nr:ROK family protein [Agriterribacter sp.]HRP54804.1 ROK family protein [Agriterribacter sp.]